MVEYRVTYDGKVVHDLGLGIACTSATCDLEAGMPGSLTFTIDPTHPLAGENFHVRDALAEVVLTDRDVELFRGRIKEVEGDVGAMRTVTAEGQLAYLGDSTVRPYATIDSDDLPDGCKLVPSLPIDHLIEEHNRHVGQDKAFLIGTDGDAWEGVQCTDRPTTLEELNRSYCDGKDRYLRARYEHGVRYVDVLDGGVGTGSQTIVFGENIMDFASSRSWDDLVTAIVATGKRDRQAAPYVGEFDSGGEDSGEEAVALAEDPDDEGPITDTSKRATSYVSGDTEFGADVIGPGSYTVNDVPVTVDGDRILGDELVARYGIIEDARSYDATTGDELLKMAAADLDPAASNIRELESVDVTVFDLSATNPYLEPIVLLDWYRIYSPPHHIDQWMPCSKGHIDICNPDSTSWHMGDIPASLTRRSALRMGLIQKGTGDLIRKANGQARDSDLLKRETNRNSERIDGAIDKAEEDLKEATDGWSAHLDEETAKWYESLSEAEKEAAQGREELQKKLDDLGGSLDGVQELADAAQRTFYGVCDTAGGDDLKVVFSQNLTKPGGQEFELYQGVVVEVKFLHADTTGRPSLNIAGTGRYPIYCYGSNQGIWRDNQVMRFVFDGSVWQCTNAPLYGSPLIVGNPAQGNLYSDGLDLDMRIGQDSYWHVDADGQRVGLANRNHIEIGDSTIDVVRRNGAKVSFGYDEEHDRPSISGGGLLIDGGTGFTELKCSHGGVNVYTSPNVGTELWCGFNYNQIHSFRVSSFGYLTDELRWVMRSFVTSARGDEYLYLSDSDLNVTDISGYAFSVTNGDQAANDFFVIGTELTAHQLIVKFDRMVSGRIRLNVLGVPVGKIYSSN